ncbi:unnamed protein product [Rotaria sp. Silwood1]|nr:unnamed protein product [Rotaria sp. Silwood1]CAF3615583.1 unnamed protein product [Rotaria sp. Silwood1]CAF3751668.1 unnamed protein product [Rotaria sp. Silwood1]CAF4750494.1 unnamed protein product [Rotaria sp. Silwood1]CAF4904387.1 unnamed protein product [Rotaria sp. Silwood1]
MSSSSTLCSILGISSAERVQAHYEGARTHLFNSNEHLRQSSHEQKLYAKYVAANEPAGPTIYSSKGEHFTEVCPSLKRFIDNELKLDLKYFGYMEYAYGLEEHRQLFRKIVIRDHQLEDDLIQPDFFEVGCFMNSTRLAMYDLGRVILKELNEKQSTRQPVVLSFEPGWDYAGVFESLQMKVLHLPLTPKAEFKPDLDEWSKFLKEQKVDQIDLIIINTQHNPTAVSTRWFQTRPFGKQFNCNAMGIAAISSSPQLIAKLNELYWNHNYINGCVNAEIICQWLRNHQQEADQFIVDNGLELFRKKDFVRRFMEKELGYPSRSICTGSCTSYVIFEAPLVYLEDSTKKNSEIAEQFSDDLYFATGVLLSGEFVSRSNVAAFVRIHLGSDPANIEEMMRRFKAAGLNYHMKKKFDVSKILEETITTKLLKMVHH